MLITRKIARMGTSNMHPWNGTMWLFTPDEYEQLPDGLELKSIMGDTKIKGKDTIDMDTRWGHIAYGVEDPWNHPLKDLFLVFKIKQ